MVNCLYCKHNNTINCVYCDFETHSEFEATGAKTAELKKGEEPILKIQKDKLLRYYCPFCGRFLASEKQHTSLLKNYCDECGQKLDWSNFNKPDKITLN